MRIDDRHILAIDPGLKRCGVVALAPDGSVRAMVCSIPEALAEITQGDEPVIAIERPQSTGQSSPDVMRTAELFGVFLATADQRGREVIGIYRRAVLRALDITGKGNRDSLVRSRLIEMHGGSKEEAVGNKANPGPLYGVTGDAWAALGVAVAAREGYGEPLPDWGQGDA